MIRFQENTKFMQGCGGLKTEGSSQNREGNDRNEPAKKTIIKQRVISSVSIFLISPYLTIRIVPRAAMPTTTMDQPRISHLKKSVNVISCRSQTALAKSGGSSAHPQNAHPHNQRDVLKERGLTEAHGYLSSTHSS